MTNYWPFRPPVQGFSIDKLAKRYKQKLVISSINSNTHQSTSPNSASRNHFSGSMHWANRIYHEYDNASQKY